MSNSLPTFGQHSPDGALAPEETASVASSHKRPVAARSCSPSKKSNCSGRKRQKSSRRLGRPENSGLSFACPFHKWDPAVYGGENGCSAWCNENIETVVRHHVLDKHRKANKARIANNSTHFLDDERFEEVVKFKRQRSAGKSKERHAEETWNAVYTLLFGVHGDARDKIPDPYFVSTTRPNNSGFSIDDIEKMIQPSSGIELEHYFRQNAKLEREREREKEKLRLAADHRKGQLKAQIGQVEAQIRGIDEDQARRAQEIDADFDERINNNRARVMAIVKGKADQQTEFPHIPMPPPPAHLGTGVDFPSQIARQASSSLLSGSAQGYDDAQPGFSERSPEALLQTDDTTASPTGTSPQLGSSSPSLRINQCEFCGTTISSASFWCEDCCSLPSLEGMP